MFRILLAFSNLITYICKYFFKIRDKFRLHISHIGGIKNPTKIKLLGDGQGLTCPYIFQDGLYAGLHIQAHRFGNSDKCQIIDIMNALNKVPDLKYKYYDHEGDPYSGPNEYVIVENEVGNIIQLYISQNGQFQALDLGDMLTKVFYDQVNSKKV